MKFGDHYLHLVLVNKFQKAKRKFWKALRFFERRDVKPAIIDEIYQHRPNWKFKKH